MPSHLTRHVFRRLLANDPIVARGCLRRQAYASLAQRENDRRPGTTCRHQPQRRNIQQGQRRNMFNLSMFTKKREPTAASMDPGLDKMMELEKMQRMKARLPSKEDVLDALHAFFHFREQKNAGIEDNQARLALISLEHCLGSTEGPQERYWEATSKHEDIFRWIRATLMQSAATAAHVQLAKKIYHDSTFDRSEGDPRARNIIPYVHSLAMSGSPKEAEDLLLKAERDWRSEGASSLTASASASASDEDVESTDAEYSLAEWDAAGLSRAAIKRLRPMWRSVLFATIKHSSPAEVLRVHEAIESRGHHSYLINDAMLGFSLANDDLPAAQRQLSEMRDRTPRLRLLSRVAQAKSYRSFLDWCVRHNELEAGHDLVRHLTSSNPIKQEWDIIFTWASATGKGVDEIDRMIGIMVQSNKSIDDRTQRRMPDVHTINALVESAISRNDPYMAERFIALGRDRDILPDARTFALQMSYRLKVNDVDGALIAYKNLQTLDLSSNEDLPAVNALIVALCNTKRHDFDTIMNVAADLSDRRVRFEAQTVATLCLLHLNRDEKFDALDLLNTHAYHYSTAERSTIRAAILNFALDPSTPTPRAWDAYTTLRELFDETPRPDRTRLMTSFLLTHKRPDMGIHIFQNMRMHSRADTMPTLDTYVTAFMTLAKLRDLSALEVIHNQLKLDYNINSTTYLLNALIIAYTACGKPRLALDFWDQLVVSREGPSYNSVHIALRACEKAPFGDLKAQSLWARLKHRGVELDQSLWASYVAALAGNGDNDTAIKTLEAGVEVGEVVIDEFLVGSLFTGAQGKEKQDEIEEWARQTCPNIWDRLVAKGVQTDIDGERRLMALDRSVAP